MRSTKEKMKNKVKSHIPKDYLGELRIMYRMTMETINGIKRTGIVNIAIITTMAAILTIFATLLRTTLSVSSFANYMGNVLEISVYLKQNANPESITQRIITIPHVQHVKFKSKESSWNELKKEIDVNDVHNPLPDTLHVRVDKPENIAVVYNQIKPIAGVSDMNYAKDIAKKMQIFHSVVNTVTILVIFAVIILTVAIINNTIQLVIQSRKDEIEIMRLMGVSNWYIKIPLILQGAIYGFMGALISLVPLNAVNNGLLKVHEFFSVPAPLLANNTVLLALFVIAVGFGAVGSLLSIKKHLQV